MPPKKDKESKKDRIKRETAFVNARKAVLDAAIGNADHLSVLPAFRAFKGDGVDAVLTYAHSAQLDDAALADCFALLKGNMEQHYVQSYGEWADRAKLAELKHSDARFVLVRDAASGALLGFVHLRFEWEKHDLVLYVMEIQLAEPVRRKGLGKRLMQTLELVARKAGLDAIWLTVLGSDTDARRFYDKLQYSLVYTTEGDADRTDKHSYSILRKNFPPPAHHHHHHDHHHHDGQCCTEDHEH